MSVVKTNRILIVDEDVPGGASSYILQQLIEKQRIFHYLDSAPKFFLQKHTGQPMVEMATIFLNLLKMIFLKQFTASCMNAIPTKFPSSLKRK